MAMRNQSTLALYKKYKLRNIQTKGLKSGIKAKIMHCNNLME